ncbi:MAG: DMT family transporter [Paraperlucidibaca sp.]
MSSARLSFLTAIAMLAFAGNSLLCRLALTASSIDAASFTTIRILSGALALAILLSLRSRKTVLGGNWLSAAFLLAYAAGFSYAYLSLSTATGALLLFGAVQATMIGYGLMSGERPSARQLCGMLLALVGLLVLFLPGLNKPPLVGGLLMIGAGIAWGAYSLRGRGLGDATQATAGNFVRAVPLAAIISIVMLRSTSLDSAGVLYAVASGALASGVGYALWYTVLPSLRATSAATVQLSVPAIAAVGGVVFLGEPISPRLALASCAILGGVGLYILSKDRAVVAPSRACE